MQNSLVCLDLYSMIIEHTDYQTLENFKTVNKFCNKLYKKEVNKRKKSFYPFGEKDAMIKFVINDVYLEEIYCIITNEIDSKVMKIEFNEKSIPGISRALDKWFHYSFRFNKWILTGKIIKSVIRLNNKTPEIERIGEIISLIFKYKNKDSYLYKIE